MSRHPSPPDMATARDRVSGWVARAQGLARAGRRTEARVFLRRKVAALKSLPVHQMPPAWAFHGPDLIEALQMAASQL